jgi:hypothetical protein
MGHIREQMRKVKDASLGEVILFAGPDMIFTYHLGFGQKYTTPFIGGLSIYNGIDKRTSHIDDDHKWVQSTLVKNCNVELGLIKMEDSGSTINLDGGNTLLMPDFGLCYPVTIRSLVQNQMTLCGPKDEAYVGPEDVARFLHSGAKGLFDVFFQNYLKSFYRKSYK